MSGKSSIIGSDEIVNSGNGCFKMKSNYKRHHFRIRGGLGEKLAELLIWIVIIAAIVWGIHWWFYVYPDTPGYALKSFIGAVNDGNPSKQYVWIAKSSKFYFPTEQVYKSKFPLARGLADRISSYHIIKITTSPYKSAQGTEKAEADVSVGIMKLNQKLYQDKTTPYTDQYFLIKQPDGWRIVLEKSKIYSILAAGPTTTY